MMSNMWLRCCSCVLIILICLFFCSEVVIADNQASVTKYQELVINGGFDVDLNSDGVPDGWEKRQGISMGGNKSNSWLVLTGRGAATSQNIKLDPSWNELTLSMRMRGTDVVVGKSNWEDARVAMTFENSAGKRVGDWPVVFNVSGTTDWIDCKRTYKVPSGAVNLILYPAVFATSGKFEIDDLSLKVTDVLELEDVDLPPEADSPWDVSKAWRQYSSTREKICINGLWLFIPAFGSQTPPVKGSGWGWFKVPGIWPVSDWSIGDPAQDIILSSGMKRRLDMKNLDQAWYQRDITIPSKWVDRRIVLDFGMVQSHARILVDGKDAGEVWFPGGELDITDLVVPGKTYSLSILVTARPLEAESRTFMAPDRIIASKAKVKFKGLTGDVFLVGEPIGTRITDVHVITSVRKKMITFDVGVVNTGNKQLMLSAAISENGKLVKSFSSKDLTVEFKDGRLQASSSWSNPKLWDTDTPENMYEAIVTLSVDANVVDQTLPVKFGFREFWIDGRDFKLNGSTIHLRALHNMNINNHADKACIEGCFNTCERMKEYGFNFLITANYGFAPGEVGYMDALFNATDETGILAAFSLPHGKDFKWQLDNPEQFKRYKNMTTWLIRKVQNHPSIITYAMNHNATGYKGDQNPLKIDGIYNPDTLRSKDERSVMLREQSMIAAGIARSIDPTRAIYHHQSGNLGDMHTVNIYLNWSPRQERSNWLEHWAEKGVKPVFFVEWGLPHIASWSSYRGPEFIWGCNAYQSVWDSEFVAPLIGDKAYLMTPRKISALKHEENLWSKTPFTWSSLVYSLPQEKQNFLDIQSWFVEDNWPSLRTWGASALLPWDQGGIWMRVDDSPSVPEVNALKNLQQPGIRPDRIEKGGQYIYDRGDKKNFEPSSLGNSFLRWNQSLVAYIGGEKGRFTEKGHNFKAGQTINKQIVVLNDSRRERTCSYICQLKPLDISVKGKLKLAPGSKVLKPIQIELPEDMKVGSYNLVAEFEFDNGEKQNHEFQIDVVNENLVNTKLCKIGLWDPKNLTAPLLHRLGVSFKLITDTAKTSEFDLIIIGREALSNKKDTINLDSVNGGQRVIVFEQTAETLSDRFGFRIAEHGMRGVFPRIKHAVLHDIDEVHLQDWQGSSTLVGSYLDLPELEKTNPTWSWCGFPNTRVWRCGNDGVVASVVIEKPPRGNWLPIMDCGFDLQYSPLLECNIGKGMLVFCQLDVTARTKNDPVADLIVSNLIRYMSQLKTLERHGVVYSGDEKGRSLIADLGIDIIDSVAAFSNKKDSARFVYVVGPDGVSEDVLKNQTNASAILTLGLNDEEIFKLCGEKVQTKKQSGDCMAIEANVDDAFKGISNSDVYRRTLKVDFTSLQNGTVGNNMLGVVKEAKVKTVLCQIAPWMLDYKKYPYLRSSKRRSTFLISRLLSNLGVASDIQLLDKFSDSQLEHETFLPNNKWVGKVDKENKGRQQKWWLTELDETDWKPIDVPGMFDEQWEELKEYDGLFWYRLKFDAPKDMKSDGLSLYLGAIDDESWVWLNGEFLGEVTTESHPKDYWSFPRSYMLKKGQLKEKDNVLVILVNDIFQLGGIRGTPRILSEYPWLDSFYLQVPTADDDPYRYYRW